MSSCKVPPMCVLACVSREMYFVRQRPDEVETQCYQARNDVGAEALRDPRRNCHRHFHMGPA